MSGLIVVLATADDGLQMSVANFLRGRAEIALDYASLVELAGRGIDRLIVFAQYDAAKIGIRSGYAVAQTLRAEAPRPIGRVILLSNELGIGEGEKAKYAGIDSVLVMPFDVALLLDLL